MPQSESNELGQNRALAVDKLTAGSFGLRSGKQRQVAKRNFSGTEEEKNGMCLCRSVRNSTLHFAVEYKLLSPVT
jgi:hypothetical protein